MKTSKNGTEHQVKAPTQSDLKRYLKQATTDDERVKQMQLQHGRQSPETLDALEEVQGHVGPLLAMVREAMDTTHTGARSLIECNRLAREAMGK